MILLTSSKMPENLQKDILAEAVALMFPHPDNYEYIENIRSRKNDASACESLFALSLLYEEICSLPSRIDTSKLVFARTESGKPYFKNSDVKFNISHSKGYVACAASVGEELGVDLEATSLPQERALKMAEKYFTRDEIDLVKAYPEAFSKIWSEKEAKTKFFGETLGKTLENDRKMQKEQEKSRVCIHRFSIGNIPVTLCTKRDFSTITFSVQ